MTDLFVIGSCLNSDVAHKQNAFLDTVYAVATLIPGDLDLDTLQPESERRVIRQLLTSLGDDWQIIPKVGILLDNANAEIDVVLASRHRGVFVVEVKGGIIAVRSGRWYQNGEPLKKDPFTQIASAKHQLARRLKSMGLDLEGLFISELVVLPDVGDAPAEGLGPSAPRSHLWTSHELHVPGSALNFISKEHSLVPEDQYLRFLRALCPSVELTSIEGRYFQGALRKIEDETKLHLDAVARLGDSNREFLVTGSAGTGKTFLAEKWARRCATRGERTLLVCYNLPISEEIAQRLEDTEVLVRTFHRLVEELLTPFGFKIPESPTSEWWETVPSQQLVEHADQIANRFDSIIIDEGQDFRPHWLEALKAIHNPVGPRRFLMLADPDQAIYVGPWSPPEGMPSLKLETNLRSSRAVARHVQKLGGAQPNKLALEGAPVSHREATADTLASVVAEEISRLLSKYEVPPAQLAVITRRTKERDLLLAARMPVRLVRWSERDEESSLCETIHRTKGLERLAIIYVDLDSNRDRQLEYIASGRAMLHLVAVVGR